MARRRWLAFLPAAVGVGILASCHPSPPARPSPLFAVKRLVEDAPASLPPGLVWGEYLRIGDEDRLALSALTRRGAGVVTASPPVEDGAAWSVAIPPVLQGESWIGVQPMVRFGDNSLKPLPLRFVAPATATAPLGIERDDLDGISDAAVVAQLTVVPDMGVRDVVSRPFTVAPGAVLGFGAGIEEAARAADPTPIDFHVSVLADGKESEVHRLRLDPAQREDHRGWVDARADLGAFAGRTVQLRLSTTFADPAHRGTSLPAWADPVVLVPRPAHPINVVLISLDTLRARSVSTYGAERQTTPNLDRFGAEGVVFDAAHTTAPHTLPAHVSVFTGLYLRRHGITNPLRAFPSDVATPTEVLRAAGYATAAFTEDGFVVPTVGIRRGFSTYRENTRSLNVHQPLGQAAQTFRAGVDWLARHRDRPFFLFLHTYQVHFPYTPPAPYDEAFEPVDALQDPDERDRLRYEQEARYLDDEMGALLEAIDDLGLGVGTLVVVTSDHGEEFMEHGARTHGFQLYEETAHVPLMLRLPGVITPGSRIADPVSLVDLAPTILDLTGAAPLVGIDGQSLAPLLGLGTLAPSSLTQGGPLLQDRRAVFAETHSGLLTGESDVFSVRTANAHCIFRPKLGTSQCYDPAQDPDERVPLRGPEQRVFAARNQMVSYLALEPVVALPASPQAPTPPATPSDNERQEKLRALGYLQ